MEPGTTVMEAARKADIYIPGLCNYPDLKPIPEVTPDMACQLCLVEINPEDALASGIADGEMIKVISRRGKVNAKAMVTEACPRGVISMSFHFAESPTNQLTNPAQDPVSKIPELKVCAVRVERNATAEGG